MKYQNIVEGTFLRRPNRFLAYIMIENQPQVVHVKNIGKCHDILKEGTKVYVQKANSASRKTRYSLVCADKNGTLINIDTNAPGQLVLEAIEQNKIPAFQNKSMLQNANTIQKKQNILYYEYNNQKGMIYTIGVTLEDNGVALFPAYPSLSIIRPFEEMITTAKKGIECHFFFVIQMKGITALTFNTRPQPAFSDILFNAHQNDVVFTAYTCNVTPSSIELSEPVRIELPF